MVRCWSRSVQVMMVQKVLAKTPFPSRLEAHLPSRPDQSRRTVHGWNLGTAHRQVDLDRRLREKLAQRLHLALPGGQNELVGVVRQGLVLLQGEDGPPWRVTQGPARPKAMGDARAGVDGRQNKREDETTHNFTLACKKRKKLGEAGLAVTLVAVRR